MQSEQILRARNLARIVRWQNDILLFLKDVFPSHYPKGFSPFHREILHDILPHNSRVAIAAPRKHGKTALALNKLIIETQLNPNKTFWYVAPTYRQAKEIVWKDPAMLPFYVPPEIVDRKNDSELTIYFKNGASISVKGADKPDSLRGPGWSKDREC